MSAETLINAILLIPIAIWAIGEMRKIVKEEWNIVKDEIIEKREELKKRNTKEQGVKK